MSAKSVLQASSMRAATSNSFESCRVRLSLRPRIPPASLHHLVNAVAVSNSSWSRPGATAAPGSAIVPTAIDVSVTPWAVAPLAVPGPQTSLRVPKLTAPPEPDAGVEDCDDDPPEVAVLLPPLRLHAPATSTTTTLPTAANCRILTTS